MQLRYNPFQAGIPGYTYIIFPYTYNHSGLSGWTVNSKPRVERHAEHREMKRKRPYEKGGRNRTDAATNQEIPGVTELKEARKVSLKAFGKSASLHFIWISDFKSPKLGEKQIYVILRKFVVLC